MAFSQALFTRKPFDAERHTCRIEIVAFEVLEDRFPLNQNPLRLSGGSNVYRRQPVRVDFGYRGVGKAQTIASFRQPQLPGNDMPGDRRYRCQPTVNCPLRSVSRRKHLCFWTCR